MKNRKKSTKKTRQQSRKQPVSSGDTTKHQSHAVKVDYSGSPSEEASLLRLRAAVALKKLEFKRERAKQLAAGKAHREVEKQKLLTLPIAEIWKLYQDRLPNYSLIRDVFLLKLNSFIADSDLARLLELCRRLPDDLWADSIPKQIELKLVALMQQADPKSLAHIAAQSSGRLGTLPIRKSIKYWIMKSCESLNDGLVEEIYNCTENPWAKQTYKEQLVQRHRIKLKNLSDDELLLALEGGPTNYFEEVLRVEMLVRASKLLKRVSFRHLLMICRLLKPDKMAEHLRRTARTRVTNLALQGDTDAVSSWTAECDVEWLKLDLHKIYSKLLTKQFESMTDDAIVERLSRTIDPAVSEALREVQRRRVAVRQLQLVASLQKKTLEELKLIGSNSKDEQVLAAIEKVVKQREFGIGHSRQAQSAQRNNASLRAEQYNWDTKTYHTVDYWSSNSGSEPWR